MTQKKKIQKKALKIRAHKALENIIENRGNVSRAMLDAGFSEAYARNPHQFVATKLFKELVEEYLPDEFLAEQHRELFNQKQLAYFTFPKTMEDEEIEIKMKNNGLDLINIQISKNGKMAFYSIKDSNSIKAGIDMGYKLKGNYAPVKQDVKQEIVDSTLTEEEKIKLRSLIK
jgi:hypothetical protein